MRVLAVGGGSGGHVTPAIAVLNELKQQSAESLKVVFVCDRGFMKQASLIAATADLPIAMRSITSGKFRRYRNFKAIDYLKHLDILFQNVVDVFKVLIGFIQSIWLILRFKPDVVFCKGGFVCLPVGYAARLLRKPRVIHDSDARPGLTNSLLAPFASKIATGYPLEHYRYDKKKSVYTGVPIREEFRPVSDERQRELKRELGVADGNLLIVSFGGGLGSVSINEAVVNSLPAIAKLPVNIISISGIKHFDAMKEAVGENNQIEVRNFVSSGLVDILAAADIAVTRASATALQELAGLEKAIVAIPARQLADQHKNAELLVKLDAAIVLSDDQLEIGELATTLTELLDDDNKRHELAMSLHQIARYDAAKRVAELVLDAASGVK